MRRAICIAGGWAVGVATAFAIIFLGKGLFWLICDTDFGNWFFGDSVIFGATPAILLIVTCFGVSAGLRAAAHCLERKVARRRSGP